MVQQQDPNPQIKWDGKTFFVTLPIEGRVIEAKWDPGLTYVVRIREFGTDEWSFGFETPLTGCSFVGLKPDTEYEMQVRSKNVAGESESAYAKCRTDPTGGTGEIVDPALWGFDR